MTPGGAALLPPRSLFSASVAFTGRGEGDMGHGGRRVVEVDEAVAARRRAVVDLPWTWLRQVHGARVVRVDGPGGQAGAVADAAVSDVPGAVLAVLTADCAPIALASPEGVIGVAHAGWRGVVAGVVGATVREMRAVGAGEIRAVVGPCIRPGCYPFGHADLALVAAKLGDGVRSTTTGGAPALDLGTAVRTALLDADLDECHVTDVGTCTACSTDPQQFSWRARKELARQATVVWR